MRRIGYYCISGILLLTALAPPLLFADDSTDEIRSQRMRMLRRGMPSQLPPPAPAESEKTAVPPGSSDSVDQTYGYTKENPVKLGGADPGESVMASTYYLNQLRDRQNQPFKFKRLGNVGAGTDGHIIDFYLLIDSTGTEYRLYIDMYHPEIHPKEARIPSGMSK